LHRPDWNEYFLGIAEAVRVRGECRRSKVGAVLVHDRRITATGYNGVAAGEPSCLDGLCPRERMGAAPGTLYAVAPCIATHAEMNAVNDALARFLNPEGGTIYVTKEPCEVCAEALLDLDIAVVWRDCDRGTSGSMERRTTESAAAEAADDRF
jgi:dCMP deaminase